MAGETTDDVLKAVKEVNSVTEGTSKTSRVFWSGGDTAKNAAEAYA